MIELLNLALAGGIAAAAAPVLVHIAHRRRVQPVEWGAMRFLQELLRRRRRSITVENLLLLAVRILALTCLALALMRPNVRFDGGSGQGAAVERGSTTAAVLLLDDGLSSAAGRGTQALDTVKKLALAYLDTLHPGDEVSILALSRLGQPVADPLYDLAAAREQIQALVPTAAASDAPALFEAGLAQLARHLNAGGELVMVGDGFGDGWHADDRARWEELGRRLRGGIDARPGSRARPNLVLLAPVASELDGNIAVSGLTLDRSLLAAGRPVTVHVALAHYGRRAPAGALIRLLVDGRVVGERSLEIQAGGQVEYAFTYAFPEAGSYVLQAVVEGARDALPADDRRSLAVQVEDHVPVLLVEGVSGSGLGGSLGLVAAALDPAGEGKELFRLTRIGVAALDEAALAGQRVVVLGDLPTLDAAGVAAIEHFVAAGGGVVVGLGANTDLALANRFWSRGGDGFLPCNLLSIAQPPAPLAPGTANLGHPALAAFSAKSAEAWKALKIAKYARLDADFARRADLVRLVTLDNGDPLLVERVRGLGRVVLCTSSLDTAWSDLPLRPAFVPLLRGVVASLGGVVLPPRNLAPGERLAWVPADGGGDIAAAAAGPDGKPVEVSTGVWDGRRAVVSAPLLLPGAYELRLGSPPTVVRYAVAAAASESRLEPLSETTVKDCLSGLTVHRAATPERVGQLFVAAQSGSIELARWLIAACAALLFLETWLTRRQVGAERSAAAARGPEQAP